MSSLYIDADLNDRDWASWNGQIEDEVIARFGCLDAAPRIEDADAFRTRVCRAAERLALIAHDGPVLAVGHDNVNRTVLASLVPNLGPPEAIGQRPGCWNRLMWSAGVWTAPVVDARPGDWTPP